MKATKEIVEKLRDQFSPDGSNLRNAQNRLVEMMVWFDSLMRENNIPYYLDYGTLLGAVRHNGFIPWDDDVDVSIPYDFYKKATQIIREANHPQFVLQDKKSDKYYYDKWDRIRDVNSQYCVSPHEHGFKMHNLKRYKGLQIDLFPCDDRVNNRLQLFFSKMNVSRGFINKYGVSSFKILIANFLYSAECLICRCFRFFTPQKDHITQSYGIRFYDGRGHKKSDVFPLRDIIFENHRFLAPHNYDAVLKDYYGDYMQLPDESELNGHNVSEIKMW